MDVEEIGLPALLKLLGFPSPWEFDGMFVNPELAHVELRFSCPRGTRHHCTECGVMDQPTHDFRDVVWEHHRFFGMRCFVRARVPRTRCEHCGEIRTAEIPWARPNNGFTRSFEALQLHMCKLAPARAYRIFWALGTIVSGVSSTITFRLRSGARIFAASGASGSTRSRSRRATST